MVMHFFEVGRRPCPTGGACPGPEGRTAGPLRAEQLPWLPAGGGRATRRAARRAAAGGSVAGPYPPPAAVTASRVAAPAAWARRITRHRPGPGGDRRAGHALDRIVIAGAH